MGEEERELRGEEKRCLKRTENKKTRNRARRGSARRGSVPDERPGIGRGGGRRALWSSKTTIQRIRCLIIRDPIAGNQRVN